MRGLTIIVAGPDPTRFRAALSIAAAGAALDRPIRVFLQADAVALLRTPLAAPDDDIHEAAGLPTLPDLLREALALDVTLTACQSGVSLAGISANALPEGVEVGGLLSELQRDYELLIA